MATMHQDALCIPEVERHVVGAGMISQAAALEMSKLVSESDMTDDRHVAIYRAIKRLAIAGKSVDPMSVAQVLREAEDFAKAGGESYLLNITGEVVTDAHLETHSGLVREYSARRKYRAILEDKQRNILDLDKPFQELLAETEEGFAALRSSGGAGSGLRVVGGEEWYMQAAAAYAEVKYCGESTGWGAVDTIWRPGSGQLTAVTGVPNHGKSSFLDAMLVSFAKRLGWRTAFFSPENAPLKRHIQKLAELYTGRRLYGPNRMAFQEYNDAMSGFIREHFVFLDEGMSGATFDQVISEFRRIKPAVQCVVVDPWNRLEHSMAKGETETEYVSACLNRAVRFAQSTGIHVFIVIHPAKLRRDKDNKILRPTFYDLHGSAHWANKSDNILMIWRDFGRGVTEFHAQKVKWRDFGTVGQVDLKYDMQSGGYRDLTSAENFYGKTELPDSDKALPKGDR